LSSTSRIQTPPSLHLTPDRGSYALDKSRSICWHRSRPCSVFSKASYRALLHRACCNDCGSFVSFSISLLRDSALRLAVVTNDWAVCLLTSKAASVTWTADFVKVTHASLTPLSALSPRLLLLTSPRPILSVILHCPSHPHSHWLLHCVFRLFLLSAFVWYVSDSVTEQPALTQYSLTSIEHIGPWPLSATYKATNVCIAPATDSRRTAINSSSLTVSSPSH